MELTKSESPSFQYLTSHAMLCVISGLVMALCVRWSIRSVEIVGSIVFVLVILFSLKSYVLALLSLQESPEGKPLPDDLPVVSIVIPSYNEERALERTIPSILSLDYPKEKLELIYVYESRCTDNTERMIQHVAQQDSRVRAIRRPPGNYGKAPITNYGIELASGDIIGILDADHCPSPNLVRLAVSHLQNSTTGCVRGRCRTANRTQNLITRLTALERDVVERLGIYGSYRMGGFANFGGGQGFFRREVLESMGPFDEDILTEDIDMSVKLHLAGYDIAVVPEMQSWEETPESLSTLIKQRRRWTRGWMQVWRKHKTAVFGRGPASWFKRMDILFSLSSAVLSALLVMTIPMILAWGTGIRTSCFDGATTVGLWLLVTTAPLVSAIIVWSLDRSEKGLSSIADLLVAPLLVPYIVCQFIISWTCLMDEFVLAWPYGYFKTPRAARAANQPYETSALSYRQYTP